MPRKSVHKTTLDTLFHTAVWRTLHLPGRLTTGGGMWFARCGTVLCICCGWDSSNLPAESSAARCHCLREDKWKHMSGTKHINKEYREALNAQLELNIKVRQERCSQGVKWWRMEATLGEHKKEEKYENRLLESKLENQINTEKRRRDHENRHRN